MLLITEFGREFGLCTACQQFGLLDPLIAFDPAAEPAKSCIDTLNIGIGPRGNLRESGDALFAQ